MENNENENKKDTEMLSQKLLNTVGEKSRKLPEAKRTQSMPVSAIGKEPENQIEHFKDLIKNGTKQQKHDAAKAIGYIALVDGFNARQRQQLKEFILDTLQNNPPRISVAFALLEALERIDLDAFWQFVVTNYAELYQQI